MKAKVLLKINAYERLVARRNVSNKEIATRINISQNHLSQIRLHKVQASPETRLKLQGFLGVSFDELWDIEQIEQWPRETKKYNYNGKPKPKARHDEVL